MREGKTAAVITVVSVLLLTILSPVCNSANIQEEQITGFPEGWSEDIRLTTPGEQDYDCDIKVVGDEIYAIWTHTNYVPLEYYIYYTKSTNGGETWEAITNISDMSEYGSFHSSIDVSDLNIHTVWDDDTGWNHINYRNSTDGGNTWNNIKRITPVGVDARNPTVFVNNSNVHIVWHDWRVGVNGQIFYRRSIDGGITFDNGQGVDEDRQITNSPATIGAVEMAGYGSNISVIWYDERNGGGIFDLYWMISKDNGNTWEDGLGNVGQDRQLTSGGAGEPEIVMDGSNIHVTWSKEVWPGPVYYIYYMNSTDSGATWSSPTTLCGPGSCGGAYIAATGNDVWVMWTDNRDGSYELFYKNSTDGGISWGEDTRLTEVDGITSNEPHIGLNGSDIHVLFEEFISGPNHHVMYKRYPDFPPDSTFNISLHEGWNLISIPLEQRDETISQVLQNISGKWNRIYYWDGADSADPWKTYRPGSSVNDLANIDNTMGFWIYINQPNVTLTVVGPIPTSTTIPLYAGWNLVGYPTQITQTVGNAMWGTGADRVEVFDPVSPYIKETGPTYIMKPGEGYWIHVPADTIWTINW